MEIRPPELAKCTDRSQIAVGPDPMDWLSPALPAGWRAMSYHFFVNWEAQPPAVDDMAWLTRRLLPGADRNLDDVPIQEIEAALNQSGDWEYLESLEQFLSTVGQTCAGILLPEKHGYTLRDDSPCWVFSRRQIWKISLSRLKGKIQIHSGGPVTVGNKGLTWGTSMVECSLAGTDAAYPGDVDAIIIDENHRARCIIEFKKHTLAEPIGKHLAARYYQERKDWRKYQRIQALVDRYRPSDQGNPLSFVILYFSTKKPEIRLQRVAGLTNDALLIENDSGDVSISQWSGSQIGKFILNWISDQR